MVTQDVGIVVAAEDVERAIQLLKEAGFHAERFEWSINLKGQSALSIQCGTEPFHREFPARAVPADIHGILMRVASLGDTLQGKMRDWADPAPRQSKRIKDLADIARLVEAHPQLWNMLSDELKRTSAEDGLNALPRIEWTKLFLNNKGKESEGGCSYGGVKIPQRTDRT